MLARARHALHAGWCLHSRPPLTWNSHRPDTSLMGIRRWESGNIMRYATTGMPLPRAAAEHQPHAAPHQFIQSAGWLALSSESTPRTDSRTRGVSVATCVVVSSTLAVGRQERRQCGSKEVAARRGGAPSDHRTQALRKPAAGGRRPHQPGRDGRFQVWWAGCATKRVCGSFADGRAMCFHEVSWAQGWKSEGQAGAFLT